MTKREQIENAFTYHSPLGDQTERYVSIRALAKDFAIHLLEDYPDGRELSLALTKLEETVMWVNASIARHG